MLSQKNKHADNIWLSINAGENKSIQYLFNKNSRAKNIGISKNSFEYLAHKHYMYTIPSSTFI